MKNFSFHLYPSCNVRMAEIKLTDHVQSGDKLQQAQIELIVMGKVRAGRK